ncbi:acyltransferase domain-containing protein [Streptacidiphilus sp. EB129]|uniref:acyltransferase domain-containing protein n=1 Tax=Streptacidiphilus sp. EB129 TaxID=3156262 RepID=UPI0035169BAA
MSLAFIFGTNLLNYDPSGIAAFHATQPAVQRLYEQVSGWTGLDLDTLLRRGPQPDLDQVDIETVSRQGSIALAAAMVGIHDVLAREGVHPASVGGLSLGAMVSSCLAGALPRRELFELLLRMDHVGPRQPDARPEGVAVGFIGTEDDPMLYCEPKREGVYLAGEFGTHPSGAFRTMLLSGYRDALEQLSAEIEVGSVQLQEANTVAVHSPLRQPVADSVARLVAGAAVGEPVLPMCSSLERRTLTTAAEIRDMFGRNAVETIRIDDMSAEMARHGARLGLVLGPSLPKGWIAFPFPVVHVESPADLSEVTAAIFEFGVVLPPRKVLTP